MSKTKKEEHIIPMAIELDGTIKENVYFLRMSKILKEKLTELEEKSKKGKFNKELHNLPLNTLKNLFTMHIYGVSDMKAVGANSDDDRWLISTDPIDIELVVKILKLWINAFYVKETELKKKRNNSDATKEYANKLIEEISKEWFDGCAYNEEVVLFDDGKVVDNDAFSIFPMIMVNNFVGEESAKTIANENPFWYYSGKNEILTEPLKYTGKITKEGTENQIKDYFSFVVSFSVQTLPPSNKPFLNINISSRRWISRNEAEKPPYYTDKKNVYVETAANKLQVFRAQYNYDDKKIEWLYTDKMILETFLGFEKSFDEIISHPGEFLNSANDNNCFIPFEYGMKVNSINMHSQDAGISHNDRYEVFESVKAIIEEKKYGHEKKANKVGKSSKTTKYIFEENEDLNSRFEKLIKDIYGDEEIHFEIYGNPSNDGENPIETQLKEHIDEKQINAKIEILDGKIYEKFVEPLDIDDKTHKSENYKGANNRIQYIEKTLEDTLGEAKKPTVAIVTIGEPATYKLGGKEDKRVDPKDAVRIGFANTGRLTQFITRENYQRVKAREEKSKSGGDEYMILSTVLDCYRQLGLNSLLNVEENINRKGVGTDVSKFLKDKIAVGIHVVNFKRLHNNNTTVPLPIIVKCDYGKNDVTVETKFNVINSSNKVQSQEYIKCKYSEFPIQFRKVLKKLSSCKLEPNDSFLYKWFNELDDEKQYIIMVAADGTTRKVIEGITNKAINSEIKENNNSIEKLKLKNQTVDLSKHKNISLVRVRVNDEVPDYVLDPKNVQKNEKANIINPYGIFKFEDVFYSRDNKPRSERYVYNKDKTKSDNNQHFTHRNIIEIYPMYDALDDGQSECPNCVKAVHNLRGASIRGNSNYTVLPLPLYLAKLLEEYFI